MELLLGDCLMIARTEEVVDFALKSGFEIARMVLPDKIIVEERVVFKCSSCENYGRSRSCPPLAPSPDSFRRVLGEYRKVILLLHRSMVSDDLKPEEVMGAWREELRRVFERALAVEHFAFAKGFPLATVIRSGGCNLCDDCDPALPCKKRSQLRYSECAMGINVLETLKGIGIEMSVPAKKGEKPLLASFMLLE